MYDIVESLYSILVMLMNDIKYDSTCSNKKISKNLKNNNRVVVFILFAALASFETMKIDSDGSGTLDRILQ